MDLLLLSLLVREGPWGQMVRVGREGLVFLSFRVREGPGSQQVHVSREGLVGREGLVVLEVQHGLVKSIHGFI